MSNPLQDFKDHLAESMGLSKEDRFVLDEGSNHPFSCKCETCRKWWIAMGPQNQEDVDDGAEPDYGPFTKQEIERNQP